MQWKRDSGTTIEELNGLRLSHFGSNTIPSMIREGHDSSEDALVLNLQCDHDTVNEIRVHSGDYESSCISFVGPTHAGKTTLLNLLKACPESKAQQGDEESMLPTTGNVNHHNFLLNDSTIVHCLDMEGDSASTEQLPIEIKTHQEELVTEALQSYNQENLFKYAELRARSVRQHFPRLAYALSDVIVHINETSLANAGYSKFVKEFSCLATEGLDQVPAPSLIIVQNQTNKRGEFNSEKLTEEFLNAHDGNRILKRYFSRVHVLRIPDMDYEEKFESATQQLCDIIYDCLWTSMRVRAKKGLAMTANYWSFMTEQVVDRFHFSKRISIGVVMTETIIKEMKKPLIDKTFSVYNILNCASNLEQWYSARKISVQYMATFFIEQMTRSDVLTAFTAARERELEKEFLALVEGFLAVTEMERFCGAREGNFPCVHTKFSHHGEHYNPSITGHRGNRAVRMLKSFVNKKADTSWPGEFENICDIEKDKRELVTLALDTLHRLKNIEQTARNFVLVRRELWKNAFLEKTALSIRKDLCSISLPVQLCTLCFHDVSDSVARCHPYCQTCIDHSSSGTCPLSGSLVSDKCVIVHVYE